jgi:hypothetical protein
LSGLEILTKNAQTLSIFLFVLGFSFNANAQLAFLKEGSWLPWLSIGLWTAV